MTVRRGVRMVPNGSATFHIGEYIPAGGSLPKPVVRSSRAEAGQRVCARYALILKTAGTGTSLAVNCHD